MKLLHILVLGLCLAEGTRALRILSVFPMPSKSHWILGKGLLRGLHERGHHITAVTVFPGDGPSKNWVDIVVPNTMHIIGGTSNMFDLGYKNDYLMLLMLFDYGLKSCDLFLQDENVRKLFNSNQAFDVIIIETFFNECFLPLANKFNIPQIAFATFAGTAWMGDMVGNPNPYAYIPDPFLTYTDRMTFFERLNNALFGTYSRLVRHFYYMPKHDEILQKHFGDTTFPSVIDIERNTSLLFLNSHFSILYPKPMVPNMVEIGGMHINPPKKLPQDLQKYLDESKDGVILFSMGSNLQSSQMPKEKLEAFLSAFSKLKQKILWKWETETLPGQPPNVKISKWLPQSDILAHKNIRLFITHGGLLSTMEAVYYGVPIVGIPIFGDQDLNMLRAEHRGYAVKLKFNNVTTESVLWAITEVLSNPSYQQNAKHLSQLFNDRPHSAMDEAAYWTEYVVRHHGARHMRSAALDLTWYQYLLLDVILFLIGGGVTVGLILFLVIRTLIKCCFGNKSVPSKGKTNQKKKKQ